MFYVGFQFVCAYFLHFMLVVKRFVLVRIQVLFFSCFKQFPRGIPWTTVPRSHGIQQGPPVLASWRDLCCPLKRPYTA